MTITPLKSLIRKLTHPNHDIAVLLELHEAVEQRQADSHDRVRRHREVSAWNAVIRPARVVR